MQGTRVWLLSYSNNISGKTKSKNKKIIIKKILGEELYRGVVLNGSELLFAGVVLVNVVGCGESFPSRSRLKQSSKFRTLLVRGNWSPLRVWGRSKWVGVGYLVVVWDWDFIYWLFLSCWLVVECRRWSRWWREKDGSSVSLVWGRVEGKGFIWLEYVSCSKEMGVWIVCCSGSEESKMTVKGVFEFVVWSFAGFQGSGGRKRKAIFGKGMRDDLRVLPNFLEILSQILKLSTISFFLGPSKGLYKQFKTTHSTKSCA